MEMALFAALLLLGLSIYCFYWAQRPVGEVRWHDKMSGTDHTKLIADEEKYSRVRSAQLVAGGCLSLLLAVVFLFFWIAS